jgi:hypothetical protein
MRNSNPPAPAGKKIGSVMTIALLITIVAGALVVPALAENDHCTVTCGRCDFVRWAPGLWFLCDTWISDCTANCHPVEPLPTHPV